MPNFLTNRKISLLLAFAFTAVVFLTPISISLIHGLSHHVAYAEDAEGALRAIAEARADGQIDPLSQMGHWLGNFFLTIGAAVAGIGGLMFDLAVKELVINMGLYITQGGIGLVVDEIWGVVRDVVNLLFIFGFVYIGLKTILDPGSSGYRKFLAQLVIAALLINFSLFFVKAVIDVANVAAIEVNQLMQRGEDINLGSAFATEIGLSNWYNWRSLDGKTLDNLGGDGAPAFYIMATIFLIITGVTFAAAAFMIVIRFVALILLMIGSPLYFAAMIFPQAAKFTRMSVPMVLQYAFYPAVFLFLMYISLRVLQTTTWSGEDNQLAALFGSEELPRDDKFFTIVLQFSVAIALIIMSMRVAKSFSMWGADAVVGTAQKAIGGMTVGVGARLGRSTIGAAGHAVTESKWARNLANRGGVVGAVGRTALVTGKKTSEASYDARNVGGIGKKLGIGEGKKGGYAQQLKDVEKKEKDIAKMIGTDNQGAQSVERENKEIDARYEQELSTRKSELRKQKQQILDQLQNASGNKADRLKAELETLNNTKQVEIDRIESERKKAQESGKAKAKAIKELPQIQYASNLEKRMGFPHNRRAYKKAAASIRKDVSKDSESKLLDAINGLKGDGEKKEA